MRTTPLLLTALLSAPLSAQLINGSFENTGSFDLTGWSWQCTTPEPVMPGAPGAGLYGARKPFSNTQGCLFEHMTQYITGAAWGDVMTLSGWVMQENGLFSAQPGLYFAEDSLGTIHLQNGVTTSATTWTWLQVTDTVYPGAISSPLVLLHTGLVGGPAFGWARFDGILLEDSLTTGLPDAATIELPFRQEVGRLFVHVGDHPIDGVQLFDLTGRMLPVIRHRTGSTLEIGLPELTSGIYLVRIELPRGKAVLRFAQR